MPKVTKKTTRKVASKSVSVETAARPMLISAVVVLSTVLITPIAWLMFRSISLLFIIPTVSSLLAALMYRPITGKDMSQEFRKETTTIAAVFAVIVSVLAALNLPKIGLDGQPDNVLPIFMILYMSLWAIVGVLVTVYLPLGITIPKNK